uniref:Uncharacterized protein n=1 Tax=Anolis carolinensis TaxID=28377 RepID=A0A803SW74_ANOCA
MEGLVGPVAMEGLVGPVAMEGLVGPVGRKGAMYAAASPSTSLPPPLPPPPRRDFTAVTLGGYNNGKAWRRRSCWRKWKQLSRLQRNVILFSFAFLAVCGVITYANMAESWKSKSIGAQLGDNIVYTVFPRK